jgi:hypothetical protein
MSRNPVRAFLAVMMSALMVSAVGCSSSVAPSTTISPPGPAPTGSNWVAISVNGGPLGPGEYVNGGFTTVTVCVPGSTTQCQTIGNILVDTGSEGLRLMSTNAGGTFSLTLPQQTDTNGNPIAECIPFEEGFTWGPVETADVTVGGETASSVPIEVMGSADYPDSEAPNTAACTESGALSGIDSVGTFGAYGVLGVGSFAEDCGSGCATSGPSNSGFYYSCPNNVDSNCTVTTEALTSQVTNPVVMFSTDNNGVIVELPSVPAGSAATGLSGYLIFGIGTENNNGLGNATVYGVDPTYGNFTTVFEGTTYTDAAFLDTGSNALFFDPTNTNLVVCSDVNFYCPVSNEAFTATNEGSNGTPSGQVSFTVANADYFDSADGGDSVFNGLAAPWPGAGSFFDWGLPFFYGLNVYVAIDGQTTPAGTGPYYAY